MGRVTPALFALCGTQHRGPGRRLLYDLNAGLGIEAHPAYTAEAALPWDVAAQVNLRVYIANQRHAAKKTASPKPTGKATTSKGLPDKSSPFHLQSIGN